MSLLEANLPENQLAWWLSKRSSTAGLWLRDIPKYYNCTLTNDEFRTYLRFFFHLDGYRFCSSVSGSLCGCKYGAIMDSTCVHFVSGCNKDNLRSDIDDSVLREYANMLRWMGFPIRVEDRNEFRSADPFSTLLSPVHLLAQSRESSRPERQETLFSRILTESSSPGRVPNKPSISNALP